MPSYRIFRLKEEQRQRFRWGPQTSGATGVKRKDYAETGAIEASNVYAAWAALRETDDALKVGDLLELEGVSLSICKYVGFEEARWVVPETKPEAAVPAVDGALPSASG